MPIVEPESFLEKLTKKLKEVYLDESRVIVEKHKKEMEKELDDKMAELVTRTGLMLEEQVMMDSFGKKLQITIIKKD